MNKSITDRLFILLTVSVFLSACTSLSPAPVENGWLQPSAHASTYQVRRGDTLYSIAWAYNMDYRALATANHLAAPFPIHPGQILAMRTSTSRVFRAPVKKPVPVARKSWAKPPQYRVYTSTSHRTETWKEPPVQQWHWPARGRVVLGFSTVLGGNKGVDISGWYGEPVRAAENGVVVYSGAGVRGYGKLIIVKHSNSYLSAYAFNKRILVREGSRVRAGQVIAEMGRDNAGRTLLHFEIRRDGLPVNPLHYLS